MRAWGHSSVGDLGHADRARDAGVTERERVQGPSQAASSTFGSVRDLKVGVLGRIVSGHDAGRYVEVFDDSLVSGGFLILTFDHLDRSGNAYDAWVASVLDVDSYFDESGWDVEWLS
jgi:hypothetical protein